MAYITTLTQSGQTLLSSVLAGTYTINVTRIGIGNGTQSDPYTATALQSQKGDASPTKVDVQGSFAIISATYMNTDVSTAFTITEMGIFARPVPAGGGTAGDEILYAYIQVTGDDRSTIPTSGHPLRKKIVVNAFVDTANSDSVTITVSTGDVEAHNSDEDAHLNLWLPGCYRGDCSTAAGTKAKTVSLDKFALRKGCLLVCKCTTANTHASPTLNVKSTGAKTIVSRGETTLLTSDHWSAGEWVLFQYDGTYWVLLERLGYAIPLTQKGQANGVATLAEDGKVVPGQLRGGFIVSSTEPSDTTLLWIDQNSRMRYYDNGLWKFIVPTWG